jgi:hypothetical protein
MADTAVVNMRRRTDSVSGHVNWPSERDGYHDTGEGGLWAYVFFLQQPEGDADPFDDCSDPGTVIMLPRPDVVCHDDGGIYDPHMTYKPYPQAPRADMLSRTAATDYAHALQSHDREMLDAGMNVLAAVCLGSTGRSWFSDRNGAYFKVTADELDVDGRQLIDTLAEFYGRSPHFVTYLDT